MTEAMHGVHVERNFVLSSGVVLAEVNLAYVTLGRLNSERNNAVLVTHGYTSSHTFVLPDSTAAEGSWSELVGPGKAIDTDRFFVISSNTLGSCYGSTGPASIDPATGRCWGPAFPVIDFSDVIALQKSLVDAWGIRKLHAVAGVSMGASRHCSGAFNTRMRSLDWSWPCRACRAPERPAPVLPACAPRWRPIRRGTTVMPQLARCKPRCRNFA